MASAESADLGDLDSLDDRDRAACEALLFRLADDELVIAERYTEWQVRAPTLESDIALANIAQDELGHARLWYEVLEHLGHDETDLIWERDPGDFRHSTLAELPSSYEEGDWADAVVRSSLYDVAEDVRLSALESSSLPAIRDRVGKVRSEERYHLDHAHNWLERLAASDEGHERVQAAVDRLFPHALTLFEPVGDVEDAIEDLGLRDRSLDEMREEWLTRVSGTLEGIGIEVPADDVASPVGRDGHHTDDWHDLHDDMTHTYRELERSTATRIIDAEENGEDR
jgi:ring-1,2-phenylacetyl-CoA epoxidase subunit PaaC